jgi:hypothetical protein
MRSDNNDVPSSKSSLISEVSNTHIKSSLKKNSTENEQSRLSDNLVGKNQKNKMNIDYTNTSGDIQNPVIGKKISWSDLVEKEKVIYIKIRKL